MRGIWYLKMFLLPEGEVSISRQDFYRLHHCILPHLSGSVPKGLLHQVCGNYKRLFFPRCRRLCCVFDETVQDARSDYDQRGKGNAMAQTASDIHKHCLPSTWLPLPMMLPRLRPPLPPLTESGSIRASITIPYPLTVFILFTTQRPICSKTASP